MSEYAQIMPKAVEEASFTQRLFFIERWTWKRSQTILPALAL
jgi:hypothetical protein